MRLIALSIKRRLIADPCAQWVRFAVIGATANGLCYLLYVALTVAGLGPPTAVTIVFLAGVSYTFWFNKSYVFKNGDPAARQLLRYGLVYFVAWALNLLALDILVTRLQFNHYIVQAVLILVIAVMTFISLKCLVFNSAGNQ